MGDEILGIHQSDVVIRGALIAGLNDLRNAPWLLQYAFASLPKDSVTANEYGAQEVQRAIDWFTHTDIPVIWNITPNEPKFPCVSIALVSSQEVEQEGTLSDTHYQPFDDDDSDWPTLVGPLVITAYDRATGKLTFDATSLGSYVLTQNMIVLTNQGQQFVITDVPSSNVVVIDKNIAADLNGCQIKPQRPAYKVQVESAVFREVYAIGCHVDSEPVHLTYLHSIVVFILLCYRETLLESRAFERSTITSSDFKRDDEALPEFLFSRYIQITGSVRQSWPKAITLKGQSVLVDVDITGDASSFEMIDEDADVLDGAALVSMPLYTLFHDSASIPGTLTGVFVETLTKSTSNGRASIVNYNATGATSYAWFAFPTALGSALTSNFIDVETGDEAGFVYAGNVFVNGVGYDVWRSAQPNLGVFQVKVT